MVPKYSQSLLPESSSLSKGWPSSSVTALRDNTGFLLRQARCPLLHPARALSFSVCVQGRVETSASRASRFSRVRLAKIWLSLSKSIHSKESVSKHYSTGSQASQHRLSVPRCRFREARKAVEVTRSFAPMQSAVCLDSSRFVHLLGFE